jgi:hypothetical protein
VDHKKGDLVAAFMGRRVMIPAFAGDAVGADAELDYAVSYEWDAKLNAYHAISPDPAAVGGHLANHSCHPNACITERTRDALMLRSTRPIKAGDEITLDYHWQRTAPAPCLCGSEPCTGNIGLTYSLVDVPQSDGSVQTYLNFDRDQIIRLLQVAEAHRNIDALRVLKVKGQWMPSEKLLEYFDAAFGADRRAAWLTQNFERLAKSPLANATT